MTPDNAVELNNHRRQESLDLSSLGPLFASTTASLLYFTGNPIELCLEQKGIYLELFNKSHRRDKIPKIFELNKLCKDISNSRLNPPNCRETDFAFALRKLSMISRVIKAGITEGQEAVTVVDLLTGSAEIQIQKLSLVMEWKRKILNF